MHHLRTRFDHRHGRRRKQAHDEHHDGTGIRRGRCPDCGKTFTFFAEARRAWLFWGFGSMLAITISRSVNHSILWMILHGILSCLYVIYYAVKREDELRCREV